MADPRLVPLVLSDDERRAFRELIPAPQHAQGLALRAPIVLACADGGSNTAVARLGLNLCRANTRPIAAGQQLFAGYAALWYSLIRPPMTRRRSIRQ